jgi:tetratricopeptide (TPR) repeat protein
VLDQDRLAALAESVADKTPSDWLAAEAGARDARERRLVSHLRAVAAIGRARASLDVGAGRDPRERGAGLSLPALPPGALWGDLRILERLGQGRFGDVYRAWDPALDREVALKLLRHGDVGDDMAAAVVDEGRLMARVRHPNVATIYGARRIDGTTGLWMELLAGPTLAAELRATGPFDAAALTDVARSLCDALQAVHDAGLVHRDVKAQNVLRDATGRVVLGDFGTGRELADPADARQGLAGTPAYIAPEIYAGRPATVQSDLYSLGVLLFHLATADFPIAARTLGELRAAHARGEQQSVAAARSDLPAAISATIDRVLDPDPARRFASARDMAAALAPPAWRGPRIRQVAVSVVALVTTVGLLSGLSRPTVPTVPIAPGSAVLVADIQNDTGDPLLDGTVRFALERELAAVAPVASRGRIDDALALMRRPSGARLDTELAREAALRDGAIAAVIGGRVERTGTRYAVTVEVRRPDDGTVVASLHEPSLQLASLLDGIRRLSAGVRRHLGDRAAMAGSRPAPMPRVTTSSLRALQLYAKAYDGLFERNPSAASFTAAESLLREAILADPGFADAHRMLAIAVRVAGERSGRSRLDEARGHADRALELAQTAGVSERIRSQGEWHGVRFFANPPEPQASEHARGVLASCRALLELDGDDVQALTGCVGFHELIGQPNSAFAMRLADVRPLSPYAQVTAARALLAQANDHARAQQYLDRAVAMPLTEETAEPVTIARLFAARQAWVEDRPHDALRIANAVRAEFDSTSGAVRAAIARPLWSLFMDLGQMARAEEIAAAQDDSVARRAALAIAASFREDPANLRRVLRRLYPRVEEAGNVVSTFVEAGLVADARRLVAAQWTQTAPRPPGYSAYVRMIDANLSLVEGRHSESIETLTAVIQDHGSRPFGSRRLRLARLLGDALTAHGDLGRAIAVFESVPPRHVRVMGWGLNGQAEWLQIRDRLATLYRRVGRTAEAAAVEGELRVLLQFADDDHPIRRRLATPGAIAP